MEHKWSTAPSNRPKRYWQRLIASGISGLNHKKAIDRMQTKTHLATIDPTSED